MARRRALLIDDEPAIRLAIGDFLDEHHYDVDAVETLAGGEACFRAVRPDVVLLDGQQADGTALELLPRLRELDPEVPVIVLTPPASIDLAVRAIKQGAEHFLVKPIDLAALLATLEHVIDDSRRRRLEHAEQLRSARSTDLFIGMSAAIRTLADEARSVADSDQPVLILGETGTGKGVLARWIHANGPRAPEAVVDLNCAGLPHDRPECVLLGCEKNACTCAVTARRGVFEVAHRGTIFLDRIEEVTLRLQPELLTVLEEGRVRRVGGAHEIAVDVRFVSATHADLAAEAAAGRFRQDLYHRVRTLPLHVPALRERPEDIPALARALLDTIARECGRPSPSLAPDTDAALERYDWPGNLRELRSVLDRAVLLAQGATITVTDLRLGAETSAATAETSLTLVQVERRHIARVLGEVGGHVSRAAERLGMPRSTLYQRLKTLGIAPSRSHPG